MVFLVSRYGKSLFLVGQAKNLRIFLDVSHSLILYIGHQETLPTLPSKYIQNLSYKHGPAHRHHLLVCYSSLTGLPDMSCSLSVYSYQSSHCDPIRMYLPLLLRTRQWLPILLCESRGTFNSFFFFHGLFKLLIPTVRFIYLSPCIHQNSLLAFCVPDFQDPTHVSISCAIFFIAHC